jgi:predicted GNAT family acetyltransferase
MTATTTQRHVRRDEARSRYELVEDGRVVGYADFRPRGDVVVMPHTVIEPSRRGQGLGAELVRGALDDLRRRGVRVLPSCWYVAEFMHGNPDYRDLVA